jgi:hypothetical protein
MTEPSASPTDKPKKRYRTSNWAQYNRSLRSRGDLSIWLDVGMQWQALPRGKTGRPQQFSDAAIQCCLTLKALFGLPLRQSQGLVQSLLRLSGLPWQAPDYSTLCRRQAQLDVCIHRSSAPKGGLHLLIDSTGVKMLGEGEWKTKKHGAEYRRQWRKVHLAIDAKTLEIQAITVTDNHVGDPTALPELLEQITAPISQVTGDGAYDTQQCHALLTARGAQALIPVRQGAAFWTNRSPAARSRNAIVRETRRVGSRQWKQDSGYHRRSLVETKMHCFKRLGERVAARKFEAQVAELHVRAAILNRFTSLGTPRTQLVMA